MKSLILTMAMVWSGAVIAQDVKPAAAIPVGDVIEFQFEGSKIFPGTTREVWVYIPKQYDGKTPACVHVNQDGIQFNAARYDRKAKKVTGPGVFDQLIHDKAIPVTIGVFVMHGRVKAANPEAALDRFNRSYEYDGLGDNYAKFLLDELLPEVEKKTAPDGRKIVLSKKGNDRSIGGTSSGAICAFTAAWERPDAFSRVFSGIGTYVGLRGGHNYSTLIRKMEPKPIRVFLEDGSNDLNIYGGDWWIANQAMERSLKFAGYEVEHKWGDGPHNNNHATQCFPEAMKWLWKDWPAPVKAGMSPPMRQVLQPNEGWTVVGSGYKFTEGPCANAKGEVFFCDVPESKIYKIGKDGKPVVWVSDSKRASGAAFGPDGRMYTVASGKVIAYDEAGKPTDITEGVGGNDLTVLNDGTIYLTNPNSSPNKSRVWMVKPNGEKKSFEIEPRFANGITCSPDQTLIYVADSRTHWVYSYQRQADGSLAHQQKYYWLHMPDTANEASADGLKTDTEGRLYVATRMGVQFADQAGRVNGIIPTPNGKCANLCFGGPEFTTLYATCGEVVYARKVKVPGSNPFAKPTRPRPPGL